MNTFILFFVTYFVLHAGGNAPSREDCGVIAGNKALLDCRLKGFTQIPHDILNSTVEKVYLSDNPYICDCKLLWFLKRLVAGDFKTRILDKDKIACKSPKEFNGRRFLDLTAVEVCPHGDACVGVNCSVNEQCVDKGENLHECVCLPGYEKLFYDYCQDIDECQAMEDNCPDFSTCHNTVGGYHCDCNHGYEKVDGECKAPEPCDVLFKPCPSPEHLCINRNRSFECQCKEGYYNETGECLDFNECDIKDSCSRDAQCINLIGSYQCYCKLGYVGDGKHCEDLDECREGKHDCHDNAVCINNVGGYKCECKAGFETLNNGTQCVKRELLDIIGREESDFMIHAAAGGAAILLVIILLCCICKKCCCRTNAEKQEMAYKEVPLNQVETVAQEKQQPPPPLQTPPLQQQPLLSQQEYQQQQLQIQQLQQQQQLQQDLFLFDPAMNYFAEMPPQGIPPMDSTMTTWSDEEFEIDDAEDDYDD